MKDNHTHCNYHGELIKSRIVRDLPLAEAVYSPNLELPRHSHRHAGFCLVLKGSYTESYGKTRLECRPSYVKFQPAGEAHSDTYGNTRVHSFIVELEHEWLRRMSADAMIGDHPIVFPGSSVAWLMMRLRNEFHSKDNEAPLAIEGLVLELIAETSRSRTRLPEDNPPRWLQQVKELLYERFSEALTLSAIAESVAVHPVYLANSFRRYYQCSIGEYRQRRRIEFACHRISTSKAALVDIALAAGFSNQSHFSRTFKHLTGMAPTQYRASHRLS